MFEIRLVLHAVSLVAAMAALVATSTAGAAPPYAVTEEREPCAEHDPLRRPFFGDTHVHTAYSFDAATQNTRNTPRDAYRFAKGERVGLQPYDGDGNALRSAQLARPLDFTMLSDHAELLGEIRICSTPGHPGYDSDICWIFQNLGQVALPPLGMRGIAMRERFNFCGKNGQACLAAARDTWSDIRAAAEEAYDRSAACSFTSFVGYEWTASVDAGVNLHRNVLFRNERVPDYPPSWVDTGSAAALWDALQRDCIEGIDGCEVLTIPHNSNLSGNALMFAAAGLRSGRDVNLPVSESEARTRQRLEPLIEIMQHKGDSECALSGDTTDEACGFEKLPYDSFAGASNDFQTGSAAAPAARASMVREALKKGLVLEQQLGVNPLKYGIIASTDSHLGTPGLTREDDPKGHGGAGRAASGSLPVGLPDSIEYNPGGLAVVWAEENSRDSLYSALARKETYGTSGTRPVVRFFGGWEYGDDLCQAKNFAERGYAGGVPMGGDLPQPAEGAGSPAFAVSALRDPGAPRRPGTALQQIQVVKGWVEDGKPREKVYTVAGGENGASVDLETCEPRGKGADALCSVWRDPAFRADEHAFYYARVLENPTCRWSQHLCSEAGVRCDEPETVGPGYAACCAESHRPTVRERAWTSPIWYEPR
ncbi:MAG: DUF3604 domain-containing protein [Deltaproteobacteria bacterium]|nr:DUF3604 domain-containing protein [Deltaproteobacteria bacterium]MBW2362098.1 DUF3604 domain-containing protein [Deltaproteobacteria bacterium]